MARGGGVAGEAPGEPGPVAAGPRPAQSEAPRSAPTRPVPPGLRTWEVQRGDDFRSIAAQVLHEAWRREPTDEEVEAHRRNMVELNRDRLQDPRRPDLLSNGQILVLPLTPRPHPPRTGPGQARPGATSVTNSATRPRPSSGHPQTR